MPWFLAERARAVERMEDPRCDERWLHRTYAQFRAINRAVSGWRRLYRAHLRPLARHLGRLRILDVGFGGGDVPAALARWAAEDGLETRICAIDADPRALAYVQALEQPSTVSFREATIADELERGERYDAVVSNHLLHHLEESELERLCADSRRLGRHLVIHNDIVRSDLAFFGFAALTSPFFHRSYIVPDGLTSIRRSYTHAELRRLAPDGWRVERRFPFHQQLIHAVSRCSPGS